MALLALFASVATAQEGSGTLPPERPTVSELVVTPKITCMDPEPDPAAPAPRIVSSFPAPEAVIRPGVLVVRLTFDRPMTCDGFIVEAPPIPNPCPTRRQQMSLSFDRRTIRVLCKTEPGMSYALRLGVTPTQQFHSLDGRPPEAYEVRFRTSSEGLTTTIAEALAQDAGTLPPADTPRP
ncbi:MULTISPECIES: hypothetical protein [Phenylobacterium]|uniref:SbsA Ig-like domain-containing protein n=1 Tax=Phenylobacterium koreense TaxID=266125 RepID=A0ABV2EFH5_9CAUL